MRENIINVVWCAALIAACGEAPELGVETDPVIFGSDNRLEYGDVSDPKMLRVADATAGLFEAGRVSCFGGLCFITVLTFQEADTDDGFKDLCDDAEFKGQVTGPICTVFLVGPDLMATAGHCLDCTSGSCPSCDGMDVVFDFTTDASGTPNTVVPDSNKYSCVGTPVGKVTNDEDWAVFQVDRPVEGRVPLIVNYSSVLRDDEMTIAGHPEGLTMKLARNGFIKDDSEPNWFGTSLDAFGGNSGSPVVDYRTGVVDGIHVRRPYYHYLAVSEGLLNKCATENVCSSSTGCSPNFGDPWAEATRFSLVAQEVPLHAALVMAAVF